MTSLRSLTTTALLAVLALSLVSCASLRNRAPWGASGGEEAAPAGSEDAEAQRAEDHEAQLRRLVTRDIEATARAGQEGREHVLRHRPYYFKQYEDYPEGSRAFSVLMHETDSRTAPYLADVRIQKVQHATRLHRKREAARRDMDFIRATGLETVSYEYRNGRWRRLGSIFVAEKNEELVDGTWVPLREETAEQQAREELPQGWFGRTWSRLTGGQLTNGQ